MTPRHTAYESPVGPLTLVAGGEGLAAVLWPEDEGRTRLLASVPGPTPLLTETAAQLDEYFAGRRTRFELPLAPLGTDFQRDVWEALGRIPYGRTTSYGELAASIGRPKAARAVGAANGKNPISIIVPCHRVVGSSGALTGFEGGIDVKRRLLQHEQSPGAFSRGRS